MSSANNPNPLEINIAITWIIMYIQSGHNFAHATTAKLSWHVQNFDWLDRQQYSKLMVTQSPVVT